MVKYKIDNILFSIPVESFEYDTNKFKASHIKVFVDGNEQQNTGEISLYFKDVDDHYQIGYFVGLCPPNIHGFVDNDGVPDIDKIDENMNKIAYISWLGGKGIGMYLYKLIFMICKEQKKSILIGTSAHSEGCMNIEDACEREVMYKSDNLDSFVVDNPYNTKDGKNPVITCKLNRLYLNYGYYFSHNPCVYYNTNFCIRWGYTNRLAKILNNYLQYNMKVNTKNSLLQLADKIIFEPVCHRFCSSYKNSKNFVSNLFLKSDDSKWVWASPSLSNEVDRTPVSTNEDRYTSMKDEFNAMVEMYDILGNNAVKPIVYRDIGGEIESYGIDKGEYWMEKIDGPTLNEIIDNEGATYSKARLADIKKQIHLIKNKLKQANFEHGDVGPHNIFIESKTNKVKLFDASGMNPGEKKYEYNEDEDDETQFNNIINDLDNILRSR